jgi:hypothetical protein
MSHEPHEPHERAGVSLEPFVWFVWFVVNLARANPGAQAGVTWVPAFAGMSGLWSYRLSTAMVRSSDLAGLPVGGW